MKEDPVEAVRWFMSAAEQGDSIAHRNLGHCYYYGKGVEQSLSKSDTSFRQADGQNNSVHVDFYIPGESVEQNYSGAVRWFSEVSELNHAAAQNKLGMCYYHGQGVEQNYTEAVRWFRHAMAQNHAAAQNNLGHCYYNGQGVAQNYAQAVEWFERAAEQGNAAAQKKLGDCWYNGQGVEQNYSQAVRWFRLAAAQGNAEAQKNLGVCYYNGEGVAQSYTQAVKWFSLAAEQGNEDAQRMLKVCSRNRSIMRSPTFSPQNDHSPDAKNDEKYENEENGKPNVFRKKTDAPPRRSMSDLFIFWDKEDPDSVPTLFCQDKPIGNLDEVFPTWDKMLFVQDLGSPADWEYRDCVDVGSKTPCILIVRGGLAEDGLETGEFSWSKSKLVWACVDESNPKIQGWYKDQTLRVRLANGIKIARRKWIEGAGPEIKNDSQETQLFLNKEEIDFRKNPGILINLKPGDYVLTASDSQRTKTINFSIEPIDNQGRAVRVALGWILEDVGFKPYNEKESGMNQPLCKVCGLDFSVLMPIV